VGAEDSQIDREICDYVARAAERIHEGRIVIHYPGGAIEVSTEPLMWWADAPEEVRRAFAARLAQLAEDPTLLAYATDSGEFMSDPEARLRRRRFRVEHK
jgi:hypothetical protein